MLVSFVCLTMWQDWKNVGRDLAQLFLDYDPIIHWSQIQMQACTTFSSEHRLYHPIKQSIDHDPKGEFIRKWIPELAHLDDRSIHEPWKHSEGNKFGYPAPFLHIDHANQIAKRRL